MAFISAIFLAFLYSLEHGPAQASSMVMEGGLLRPKVDKVKIYRKKNKTS